MSAATRIRISSRALGRRDIVTVYVYETVEELRAAGERWTSRVGGQGGFDNARGITHYVHKTLYGKRGKILREGHVTIVRLWREQLGSEVVTHEMVHAAMAIYGDTLADDQLASEEFHAANEPVAYLVGELCKNLVNRLYALGYYGQGTE